MSSFHNKSSRADVNITCALPVGSRCLDNLKLIDSFELVSVNVMWPWLCLFQDLEHGLRISCSNALCLDSVSCIQVESDNRGHVVQCQIEAF